MDDQDDLETSSPATRMLDALGRGDLNALLLEFRPTTILRTDDHSWSVQGEEEVLFWLEEAFEQFPGLVFDSHARHVGYGQVIEEARVRDIGPPPPAPGEPGDNADHSGEPGEFQARAEGGGALVLDRDFGKREGPQLNMPVRVTVLHDDRFVHEIIASYPRPLLRAAMGQHVDPLDMAVSEIQSAFVAPAGSGFKTYQMGSKPKFDTEYAAALPVPLARVAPEPDPEPDPEVDLEPDLEPEPVEQESWTPPPFVPDDDEDKPRRRRALVVVPVVMVLVAGIAAGSWWLGRDDNAATANTKDRNPGQSATKNSDKPTKKPSSASPDPTPTQKPSATKTPKPDVTLKSDLAFDKNSAELSDAAKVAVARLADQVRAAKLKGTIAIHGYTDSLGSAAHGLELSRQRAEAVRQYLRQSLGSYDITITAFGHGEADPIASNATEAGRQKNRRVTITLPKP
jgi:outer membrane protein OmpA-like peptidoglycan-associated protein